MIEVDATGSIVRTLQVRHNAKRSGGGGCVFLAWVYGCSISSVLSHWVQDPSGRTAWLSEGLELDGSAASRVLSHVGSLPASATRQPHVLLLGSFRNDYMAVIPELDSLAAVAHDV